MELTIKGLEQGTVSLLEDKSRQLSLTACNYQVCWLVLVQ
jgi:hypothetical protein